MRALLLTCFAALMWPVAAAQKSLSTNAAAFVARGSAYALRVCDLSARTCSGAPLIVQGKSQGNSNDEERVVETFVHPGLAATVIYPVARPRAYYLAAVEVSTAQWSSLFGLGPGTSRNAVLAKLGRPASRSTRGCDEYVDEATQSVAVICYESATVTRIRWEHFID